MRKLVGGALVALSAMALPASANAATTPTATVTPDNVQFWPYVDDNQRDHVKLRYRINDPDLVIEDSLMPTGTMTITDANQIAIRTFDIPPMGPDDVVSITWDGTDAGGSPVPAGTYTVTTTQAYHYLDPAGGATLLEGALSDTTRVETYTGTVLVEETWSKNGAKTARRECRVLGGYGTCSHVYATYHGELLVGTSQEQVTLTYRFRSSYRFTSVDVRVKHRRATAACHGFQVSRKTSGSAVTVTVSMGGMRLSQCLIQKVFVDVSAKRTV
jgi:hypothetical protein